MIERAESTTVTVLRGLLTRALPADDWSDEFVEALEIELREISEEKTGWSRTRWYLAQVFSPKTMMFVWAVNARRRRRAGRDAMGGGGGTFSAGLETDMRQALRGVLRDRWAAALVVLTLGAGIGSVTAMYGLGSRLFLSGPAHVVAPDEIVRAYLSFAEPGGARTSPWIPFLTARAIQETATVFDGLTLYRTSDELADFGERVQPLVMAEADGQYFDVMATRPAAGRFFRGDAAIDPWTAVLSHRVATAEFGSIQAALGRTIRTQRGSHTVVGVAPPAFAGPGLDRIDVWVPVDQSRAGTRNWWVAGRIPADRSRSAAAREAQSIHEGQDPGRSFQWAREGSVRLAGIGTDLSGERSVETSIARLLLPVIGLLFLIALANVLNVQLARLARRREEVLVRLALGIGRVRLARLLLLESLLLSFLGGLASMPIAHAEGMLVRSVLLPDIAWAGPVLRYDVLFATLIVALMSCVVLGLVPARLAGRTDLSSSLTAGRWGSHAGGLTVRTRLATAQIALSAALLLCAGLFVKSFWTIRVTDLGVDADEVDVVHLRSLESGASSGGAEGDELYRRAMTELRRRDHRNRYALAVGLPFYSNFGMSIHVDGRDSIPELPGGGPFVSAVSADYFEIVGTTILRGAGITEEDVASRAQIVVVGEATARALWPAGDAIGRCIRVGAATDPCRGVVGIARDVHRLGYREPPSLQLYLPLGTSSGFSGATLLVRARPTADHVSRLRAELASIDPAIDYVEIRRLDSFLEPGIRPWRLGAVMVTMAAVLAIVISGGGVFGVLVYVVARRRREIGVRIALGATGSSIRGLVLRTGLTAGLVGVAAGYLGVLAAARWLDPLLFETRVADPLVMLGVGGALLAVTMSACLLPAAHAARVDPVRSLRAEA